MEDPSVLLHVSGEVEQPLALTFGDLSEIDAAQQIGDVSQMDSQREGGAVTLAGILAMAKVRETASYITLHASTDDFHASIPLDAVREHAILIYRMAEAELPKEMGGPVRFYIRDFADCHTQEIDECANVKHVDHIEITLEKGHDNRPTDEEEHADLHRKQGE
ncbi:MAG: molybdopterin-dependent oxidoreductase [Pirellulales bacterium]